MLSLVQEIGGIIVSNLVLMVELCFHKGYNWYILALLVSLRLFRSNKNGAVRGTKLQYDELPKTNVAVELHGEFSDKRLCYIIFSKLL